MTKLRAIISVAAVSLLGLLVAFAILGAWPFWGASDDPSGRHVIWEGRVALKEAALYALDLLPVAALGQCARCLSVGPDGSGHPTLKAGNGVQGWPGKGSPSFVDCVVLRNKRTYNEVALDTSGTSLHGVAVHGWTCATGATDDGLMRMRYEGRQSGRYVFSVTSWGRPPEG